MDRVYDEVGSHVGRAEYNQALIGRRYDYYRKTGLVGENTAQVLTDDSRELSEWALQKVCDLRGRGVIFDNVAEVYVCDKCHHTIGLVTGRNVSWLACQVCQVDEKHTEKRQHMFMRLNTAPPRVILPRNSRHILSHSSNLPERARLSVICTDFVALVHGLGRAGDIAIDSTDFTQARDAGRAEGFSSWLRAVAKQKIPVFSFSSQRDKSGLSTEQIQKITRSLPLSSNEYVRLFTEESATHNLDSYYDTMARSVLWGAVAASEYVRLLAEDSGVYLWGSLVGISSWSPGSDIDVLLIANLEVEDYKNIVKVAQAIEAASGIYLGISVNRPSDLKRRDNEISLQSWTWTAPGGESMYAVAQRMRRAIKNAKNEEEDL